MFYNCFSMWKNCRHTYWHTGCRLLACLEPRLLLDQFFSGQADRISTFRETPRHMRTVFLLAAGSRNAHFHGYLAGYADFREASEPASRFTRQGVTTPQPWFATSPPNRPIPC